MGFFSDNEIGSLGGSAHIEAAEGYSGTIGCQIAMVESHQNDLAIFTAGIKADIRESKMIREGASDQELASVQEGALGNFWEKIKEFIRKIIAKVKGVYTGFIAKLEAWMNKDGRDFFNKYKKEIFGKEVEGLKVRFSKPKNIDFGIDIGHVELKDDAGEKEHSELVGEYLGEIISPSVKNSSPKEFRKEYHDACFEDEEKAYDVKRGEIADLVGFISGKTDIIKAVRTMATNQEKGLNKTLKQVEKYAGSATNYAVDKSKDTYNAPGGKFGDEGRGETHATGNPEHYQKRAAGFQKQVSAMQEALNIANSAALTEIKFAVAQSRRIAAAIVAYHGSKHEDAELLQIEQEAAEYEVLSALEAVN